MTVTVYTSHTFTHNYWGTVKEHPELDCLLIIMSLK